MPPPAERPLLVATDLDGTLLRTDGLPSERSRRAVTRVQAAGIRVVLVTARPPRWLHDLGRSGRPDPRFDLTDLLADDGIAICANGALVYDGHRRAIVEERTLPVEIVLEIVGSVRAAVPDVAFAVETGLGLGREPHFVETVPDSRDRVADISELLDPPPAKLLARAPHLPDPEFVEAVRQAVGDLAIVAYSGAAGLAEMSAPGVTKAAVLSDWAASWGIAAADVWAFGDMPNDLPMLTWAGRSFAVANGHPDVLAAATDTCPPNDDDGVAQILERLFGDAGAPDADRAS